MKLAVTGHRPQHLGGFGIEIRQRLYVLATDELYRLQPATVYTGMALGWDMAVAAACIQLGIQFVACVPCDGQAAVWKQDDQRRYDKLLGHAAEIINVSPGPYAAWKMQTRNRYMVDRITDPDDLLLALYDGSPGGTANCVKYAELKAVKIENCWPRWQQTSCSDE